MVDFKQKLLLFGVALWFAVFFYVKAHAQATTGDNLQWQYDDIIVNSPSGEVLEIVSDCKTYNRLFPYIKLSRVLSINQCYLENRTLGERFWMHIRTDKRISQDKKTVWFTTEMVEGNVKYFEFRIKVIQLGENKTTVIFGMKADLGIPGVPDSMVQDMVKKIIHKSLVNLQVRLLLGKY